MIDFILGEDKHIPFRVHAHMGDRIVVESAHYILKLGDKVEAEGNCEILNKANEVLLDIKLNPLQEGMYWLEVTYMIADETLKHVENVRVKS